MRLNLLLPLIWLFPTSLFALSVSAQQGAKSPVQRGLTYLVDLAPRGQGGGFSVEFSFRGSQTGTSKLVLPLEWDGQQRLYNSVKNLRALSAGVQLRDAEEPHVKVVTHDPGQIIYLRYEVVQDWQGDAVKDGLYNRAIIRGDFFYFVGNAFWVLPDWDEETRVSVELRWKNIPAGWAFGNSFGMSQSRQDLKTTVYDFQKGVFFGGDFRVKTFALKGGPLNVATRGVWKFPDAEFHALAAKLVRAERSFWRDYNFPLFLIVLFPTDDPARVYSGESRTDACVVYASRELETASALKKILAHELFHAWNPNRLGTLDNEGLYWFTEGFTEYYASQLLLRAGLISSEDYLAQYNAVLKAYYTSPARALRNEQIVSDRQKDDDARRQPYLRGNLLAHLWDARIRSATRGKHSLDDLMRDLLKEGRRAGAVLSAAAIDGAARRYLEGGVRADVERYVEAGALIPQPDDLFGPCAESYKVEYAPYDPGFDVSASFEKRIMTGVKPGGEAYKAGLREGQKWLKGGLERDPAVRSELVVEEAGVQKTIRYYPRSADVIRVPQYKLRGDADRAPCVGGPMPGPRGKKRSAK